MPNFGYPVPPDASIIRNLTMLVATIFLAPVATPPSLCFVARFYKSGSAKSKFELYVSDLSAGNRKMLPTPEEPVAAQWIGRDRIAWFSEKALWTSKLAPWKPMMVKRTTTLHFGESRYRDTEPGKPIFVEDFDRSKGIFVLDPSTLKVERAMESPHHQEIQLNEEKPTEVPNPSSPEHPLALQMFEEFKYWRGTKEETCEWPPYRAWNTDGGNKLWVLIGTHFSSSGDVNGMMLFEKGRDPRTLFDDGNCVDFWSSRSLFAYCTYRNTSSLGKKQVWTSELHVGDYKKGTNKAVIKGLAWVPSVSIRP